jgi:hypothetical protein
MFFEGQRIRAVCDVPARSFLDRHVLKGLTYEVAEFADLLGLPSVKLKGDAPDRWIPARVFELADAAERRGASAASPRQACGDGRS